MKTFIAYSSLLKTEDPKIANNILGKITKIIIRTNKCDQQQKTISGGSLHNWEDKTKQWDLQAQLDHKYQGCRS